MSESPTITRITHIEDPALVAFAARVAHSLLAAGHLAAARLGRSDLFGTPPETVCSGPGHPISKNVRNRPGLLSSVKASAS